MQNFEASLTIVFAIWSIKECMIILLFLDMFYNEWKMILDKYNKLLARPQPIKKSNFNYLVGLKETHIVKFAHGLKMHEILLWDQLRTGSNLHLLTMVKFWYNIKKRRVIQNKIMVFHDWL